MLLPGGEVDPEAHCYGRVALDRSGELVQRNNLHDMVTSLYTGSGREEARAVANNLLFDVARSIGKADAKAFHARMGVTDAIDRVAAGPVHFSFSGWAFVKILPESLPSPDDDFFKKLGIDSLQALELLTRLENHFSIELPDYEVQGVSDFRTLAERIQARL